ncbi:Do family serine endopeptidase [Pseudoduganella aquatica]|uniref:Probable periplasmic serine endoprotease DegP-like n=1 Tax=Pseudoduganella aquatica TaxID=2660641 RepID=A0A7X4KMR1_9BURK|nr:Do family serine endopeptidase [Pseudoduganella aquatica]MYN08413.1 Do family serine endopeptidase [Pseudoduganella aquatica]
MQNQPVSVTMKRGVAALAVLGALGAGGAVVVQQNSAGAAASSPAAPAPAQAAAPVAAPMISMPDFSVIAERNGPAVVNISVTGSTKTAFDGAQGRGRDPFGDDPFFEFFRRFQQQPGQQRGERSVPTHGVGSGFIISPDGLILTNAHVVRDASEVTVKMTDRREYRAKVLGSDPKTDVAVLKIEGKNLPVVPLGRTKDLKVGEWVLAIGSPYGLESTVTAGVVSAKGRSLGPEDSYVPFIQTDVAVNPGNSGGPLFNTRGEVIGINSQIYSQTGGYQGLSFAIPIDVATKIKDQIVSTGKVAHAKLGVTVQEVDQAFADSFKLDTPEGALVANVEPGGPADKAGLKSGDVIRKINGQKIIASGDLPAVVGVALPGEKVVLEVWRQGKAIELSGKLGNAADKVADVARADDGASSKVKLGLQLRPLDPVEKRQSGINSGLLIEGAGGAAAYAGVQPGDVLLSVNGRAVNTIEQVRDVMAKSEKSVALLIQRGDEKIFIPVRIG